MDKTTVDTYDQLATAYDQETTNFWNRFPRGVIDTFIESIRYKKVLDVGSGPGRDGLIIAQRGLDVTCLDASAVMVDLCKKNGLKSVLGDFNQLPFDDGEFGGVWAYTSLLHVPKAHVHRALREIKRVLRPDGVFGLGMIEGDTEGYRPSSGATTARWFSYYSEEELRSLLAAHGFAVTHFEQFTPGPRNYLNFISIKSRTSLGDGTPNNF